jgi:MFS family permease
MKIRENYNHTIYASYMGYITQAIINNFVPLFVDRIGYKVAIVSAHIFASLGLIGLAVFPYIFTNSYVGILLAIVIYAMGGGIIEVLVSPIVEACPTTKKEATMSLLHSFYCWGHVFVVISSTLFFYFFGIVNWRILACIWALVPLGNSIYYSLVPINVLENHENTTKLSSLFNNKTFWLLCMLMVSAGASEQAMSQWASAFAENGLQVSKTIGDLAGPTAFAILMGCARVFYAKFSEKVNLSIFMLYSGILCIISYLVASLSSNPVLSLIGCTVCGLSVGILWPGTFSIAVKLIKKGGTALFAILALAGDLGCAAGPAVVGIASKAFDSNIKKGILVGIIFPILLVIGLLLSKKIKPSQEVVY